MARKLKSLTKKEIDARMKTHAESGWTTNQKATMLTRSFAFPSFINALAFVAKITVHAEVLGHHPDIELSYGKVKVKLTTHEVKGLTKADFELAKRIDNLRLT
jgi:4a-hydroxytetrahydrobiopterin dehydratase